MSTENDSRAPTATLDVVQVEERRRSTSLNSASLPARHASPKAHPKTRDVESHGIQSSTIRMPEKFDEMSYVRIALVLFRSEVSAYGCVQSLIDILVAMWRMQFGFMRLFVRHRYGHY